MSAGDVFPRRNLPPESEEWGREVEDRIYAAENSNETSGQSLDGLGRASSATLIQLAQQIQEVQALYDALPVANQATTTTSNFANPSGWTTIASVSFPGTINGTFTLSAVASGQLVSGGGSTNMECSYRIVAGGVTSAVVPGLYASPTGVFVNNFMVTWGFTLPMTYGLPISVQLQANPVAAASWPSGTGSYAVLSAFGTTTRV